MDMYMHRPGYLILLAVGFIVFVFMLVINGLAGAAIEPFFYNSTATVSDYYYTDITPAGPTFSIWGVVYAWQCVWWAYAFSTVCRRGVDGYLYYSPGMLPAGAIAVFVVNNGLNIGWLILWDRSLGNSTLLIPAVIVIALLPFTAFWCLFISARALSRAAPLLQLHGLTREVWLVRFTFQNGVAFYLTWTAVATLLNLAMALRYVGKVDVYVAGSVSLAILSAEVVIWFCLDIFVLDRHVRYLFAPYAVLVWALGGVVGKNYPPASSLPGSDRNPYWQLALLGVSCLALVIKLIVMIWRHVKRPLTVFNLSENSRRDGHHGDAGTLSYESSKI